MAARMRWSPGPAVWKDDLAPISAADWNYDRAAHLLAHAGFGGTPAEIQKLADAGLERAVGSLVHYESIPNPAAVRRIGAVGSDADRVSSRPTRPIGRSTGSSMGVEQARENRPVSPSDRFFYWLRPPCETRQLGYWWANRMLQTTHPWKRRWLRGHFATHGTRSAITADDAADRPVRKARRATFATSPSGRRTRPCCKLLDAQ